MVGFCQASDEAYSWCCNSRICAGKEKKKQIKCFTTSTYFTGQTSRHGDACKMDLWAFLA